jgi:hypothetical protein
MNERIKKIEVSLENDGRYVTSYFENGLPDNTDTIECPCEVNFNNLEDVLKYSSDVIGYVNARYIDAEVDEEVEFAVAERLYDSSAMDRIGEMISEVSFDDFRYEVDGKIGYCYEDMLAMLLLEEVIFLSDDGKIWVHVSDSFQPEIKKCDIPALCKAYIDGRHSGVVEWAKGL